MVKKEFRKKSRYEMFFYILKLFRGPENYSSHEMQLIPALFFWQAYLPARLYVVQMGENGSLPVDSTYYGLAIRR
jgi:hypothetical protein